MLAGIWDEFLTIAREEAGSRIVETWFKAVSLSKWDAIQKIIYLKAPNPFVKDWIRNNYTNLMQLHLGRLLNIDSLKVVFIDGLEVAREPVTVTYQSQPASGTFLAATTVPAVQKRSSTALKVQGSKNASHINSSYVFSNFIVGPSNSLAYAAAHAVTENPGRLYNPLFIYGGSGLGKTHLLHAIGNEIKVSNKNAAVLYQTADRFVNEFISAIRFDKMYKFQAKYKDIDVLLIDDVQFISNKEQTQEAFFHIFNALYDAKKQIVFSSDTFPQNIQGLAERLRSRLACGLVTDMYMPSLETKVAILKKKAEQSDGTVSDEIAHFIASRVISNIRELEGALVRVMAFASLTKQPVTLELANRVLNKSLPEDYKKPMLDFNGIVKRLNAYYPYSLADLQAKGRNKELAFVRQIAMFFMKKLTDKSLRDIGIYLGGRDHSTVMHAIDKVEKLVASDEAFAQKLQRIEQDIIK
ncbi:MAG: chromosomal replication initiator protein DnaA [Candidatus Dependentiae bacterium]|nr:chromosomal replication initiator protein DnaA [Candidatus Dependentiae bacterium]